MLTPIHTINIGIRIREDMGDIAGLAESIKARGLLHPIIVDEEGNLIAGHRRLQAHMLLGREVIETRTIADLTEKAKRLIELEENTKRKALTELEASKNLAELAEAAADVLKEEVLPSPSDGNAKPSSGRPEKPDSREKVAERLGVSTGAISEARQYVAAVEQFPALETLPKKEAIRTAKEPEKAERYQKAVEEFPQLAQAKVPVELAISGAEKLRDAPPNVVKDTLDKLVDNDRKYEEKQQLIDAKYRDVNIIHGLITSAVEMTGVATEERIQNWLDTRKDRMEIELSIGQLQGGIKELEKLKSKIQEALKGPRKVGKGRE
ncbi:ParB N-terminal domain-containing protein [Paenibacillus sp. NPDC101420]|uniref:ParB N-terminal domain-containing protein n=1 Tax=Paenibacillus sp. NPDC101420 TaxID=3390602 RepID=UPI003D087A70